RPTTVRTFATHAAFEQVLARATPLFPIAAITDGDPAEMPAAGRTEAASPAETGPDSSTEPPALTAPRPRSVPWRALTAAAVLLAAAALAWLGTTIAFTRAHGAGGPVPAP